MKDKKLNKFELTDFVEAMTMMTLLMKDGNFFGGMPRAQTPRNEGNLNDGYELIKIPREMYSEKSSSTDYSYLYKNGKKISDIIFRKGGMCSGYKEGFVPLIMYTLNKKTKEFDFGVHVIVDYMGRVVLAGTGMSEYPSHVGGIIGKLKDKYINLITSEEIAFGSQSLKSDEYLFVEHRYGSYGEGLKFQTGVYKIDLKYGGVEIFPIKK